MSKLIRVILNKDMTAVDGPIFTMGKIEKEIANVLDESQWDMVTPSIVSVPGDDAVQEIQLRCDLPEAESEDPYDTLVTALRTCGAASGCQIIAD